MSVDSAFSHLAWTNTPRKQGGIGKLEAPFDAGVEALLEPYRAALAALNPQGGLRYYPGSPELALRLMREEDRLTANELHPQDAVALERHFLREPRAEVTVMDAETCLKARLPPPERRGIILIDPPYEALDEAQKSLRMLAEGLRRFAQGVFVLWYPLKAGATAETVLSGAAGLGAAAVLKVELRVREAFAGGGLAGSGLVIVNTPWRLDEELREMIPALAQRLGLGGWGQGTVEWMSPPR